METLRDPNEVKRPSVASISESPHRASLWDRLEQKWSQIQVGHQGSYSVERLELLHEYCQTTSITRVILVCLLTPVPALVAAVMLESLPLSAPSEGWAANWVFWVRVSLMTFLISGAGSCQIELFVPEHNYSFSRLFIATFAVSVIQLGTYITEAVLVGFPVPFMWQLGAITMGIYVPVVMFLVVGPLPSQGSPLGRHHKNFQDSFIVNLMVTGIYPFCRVLYELLPHRYEGVVLILLSIWKFGAKRFAVRKTRQVEDFIPELVAFSVDFFGSLFISVCMSTSRSFYLIALFIGVDLVHLVLKFREIATNETLVQRLQERHYADILGANATRLSQPGGLVTVLTEVIRSQVSPLDGVRLWANPPHLISEQMYLQLQTFEASGMFGSVNQSAHARTIFSVASRFRFTSWVFRRAEVAPVPVVPRPAYSRNASRSSSRKSCRAYNDLVLQGLQLLFYCEYLVLVEYVECVVPLVFIAYKSVLEQLPNVVYYPGGAGTWGTTAATNLLVFSVLEVGSLVLVHFYLRHRFAFSPLSQLAFVLETQFFPVQATLFSLTLFALQYQLAHLGVDFTFQFEWLKR